MTRRRTIDRILGLLATAALAATLAGCARHELARAKEARKAYEDCLAENPRDPDRCATLRTAMNRRYDEYEAVSRERARSWREDDDWAR
jgi:hypothetical protein